MSEKPRSIVESEPREHSPDADQSPASVASETAPKTETAPQTTPREVEATAVVSPPSSESTEVPPLKIDLKATVVELENAVNEMIESSSQE